MVETKPAKPLSGDAVATMLRNLGTDRNNASRLFQRLEGRDVSKAETIAAAAAYTGAPARIWSTKKAALAAIRSKFDELCYQESKLRNVDRATPW